MKSSRVPPLSHPHARWIAALGLGTALIAPAMAASPPYPITPAQRQTAQQVAHAGVPLTELAPNAPDSYTVKSGDTLWDISQTFLRRPWRWPELWGMNLEDIRNPHLIYPGQVLVLEKSAGRARLRVGRSLNGSGSAMGSSGTTKLSPRIRSGPNDQLAIGGVPMHLIEPFLIEAVVLNDDELASAPRIVATPEGRGLASRGDLAYVRGDTQAHTEWRLFRQAKPLKNPGTGEILGYEAAYVGTAERIRSGGTAPNAQGGENVVPATFSLTSSRQEANIGDRLAPVPARDFSTYAPHAPTTAVNGRIVSVYGDAVHAGQNHIIALNLGSQDGMERGHVLALWEDGGTLVDRTDPDKATLRLPDERKGLVYVFRVFKRVSYALILSVERPAHVGDRLTPP